MQCFQQDHMFENLNLGRSCRDLGGWMYNCRRWITGNAFAEYVTNLYFLSCSNFSHHMRKCSHILLLSWSLSFMHSLPLLFLKLWGKKTLCFLNCIYQIFFMIIKVTNMHTHILIGYRSWIGCVIDVWTLRNLDIFFLYNDYVIDWIYLLEKPPESCKQNLMNDFVDNSRRPKWWLKQSKTHMMLQLRVRLYWEKNHDT